MPRVNRSRWRNERGAVLLLMAFAVPSAGAQPAAPSLGDAAVLAQAWSAAAAGRSAEVERLVEPLRTRVPLHRDAWSVTITAYAIVGDGVSALAKYDAWTAVSGADDPPLLRVVAMAVIRELARTGPPNVKLAAVTALTQAGDPTAASVLGTLPKGTTLEDEAARAAAGDGEALSRLTALAGETGRSDKTAVALALQDAGNAGRPTLEKLLVDPAMPNRLVAALALGRLGDPEAVPALERALAQDPAPQVRAYAAVALGLLGDAQGRDLLTTLLTSPAPDVQLLAAESLTALGDGSAADTAVTLLASDQPVIRLMAARVAASSRPEAAAAAVSQLLEDPNPLVRAKAAEAVGEGAIRNLAQLRRLLQATDPVVRLHAAAGLLRVLEAPAAG